MLNDVLDAIEAGLKAAGYGRIISGREDPKDNSDALIAFYPYSANRLTLRTKQDYLMEFRYKIRASGNNFRERFSNARVVMDKDNKLNLNNIFITGDKPVKLPGSACLILNETEYLDVTDGYHIFRTRGRLIV